MMKFNSAFFEMMFLMLLMSVILLSSFTMLMLNSEIVLEWKMVNLSTFSISLLWVMDFVSLMFFNTVMLISSGVFLFSKSYMMLDNLSNRFGLLVLMFVMSMSILIFSPNIISILIGWDGLGVTSYLLVCYYSSEKSYNASMLTALTNRLGDIAILLSIAMIASFSSLFNFYSLCFSDYHGYPVMILILAAMTKSAQIPFSSWLPAAMAAPTPVSALVHSSTLVTAGVYLLIRFNYSMSSNSISMFLLTTGSLTMFMAGLAATMEMDMKKVIALSTLSQLGLMFFTLGLNNPFTAFFHLISHAYFKAMMFMAAGSAIHMFKDYQDVRKMGSNSNNSPFTSTLLMVSSISLCGMPFMSGFYSKDMILEFMLMNKVNLWTIIICTMATMLTVIYSARVFMNLHFYYSKREPMSSELDMNNSMIPGAFILFMPSIMGGFWFFGIYNYPAIVFVPMFLKIFFLVMIMIFIIVCLLFTPEIKPYSKYMSAFHLMWFMPLTISLFLSKKSMKFGKFMYLSMDVSWFSYIINNLTYSKYQGSLFNSLYYSNILKTYLIIMFMLILM